MVRSPSTKLLAAAGVVMFATVATIAGAGNTQQPGVRNGVITACVEPPTKGNRATSGDLNVLVCLKGARRISWNIRGPRGLPGAKGATRGGWPGRCAGRPGRRPGRWAGRPRTSRSRGSARPGRPGRSGRSKGDTGTTGPPGAPGTPGVPGVVVTHSFGTDSGHCGRDWATTDYTRTLQFIPQNNGTIQVVRTYDGTFTTIAGSPQPNPRRVPSRQPRTADGWCHGSVQRLRLP